MGDRGNVYFKQSKVCLYTHDSGLDLSIKVRDALKRGKDRWADAPYLARIVFCEMVGTAPWAWKETTGFGISHEMIDNNHCVIVIDTDGKTVAVTSKSGIGFDPASAETNSAVKFDAFVNLSDDQVRAWHLSKCCLQIYLARRDACISARQVTAFSAALLKP